MLDNGICTLMRSIPTDNRFRVQGLRIRTQATNRCEFPAQLPHLVGFFESQPRRCFFNKLRVDRCGWLPEHKWNYGPRLVIVVPSTKDVDYTPGALDDLASRFLLHIHSKPISH